MRHHSVHFAVSSGLEGLSLLGGWEIEAKIIPCILCERGLHFGVDGPMGGGHCCDFLVFERSCFTLFFCLRFSVSYRRKENKKGEVMVCKAVKMYEWPAKNPMHSCLFQQIFHDFFFSFYDRFLVIFY